MKIKDAELKWLGHAAFLLKASSKTIYIDPYQLASAEEADIILITHSHYDHCSIADIQKIVKHGTIIVMPASVQSKVTKLSERVEMKVAEPWNSFSIGNIKIDVFPAYNINKQFHPKQEKWLSYVITKDNVVIYHAGDTDLIPEMQKLTGYGKKGNEFIALLPVGGTYTMNAEEAARAASIIKPSLAIPMHFASIIGTKEDAEKFVKLCREAGIKAEILEKN